LVSTKDIAPCANSYSVFGLEMLCRSFDRASLALKIDGNPAAFAELDLSLKPEGFSNLRVIGPLLAVRFNHV